MPIETQGRQKTISRFQRPVVNNNQFRLFIAHVGRMDFAALHCLLDPSQSSRQALQAAAWGEPVPKTEADEKKLAAKGRKLLAEAKTGN